MMVSVRPLCAQQLISPSSIQYGLGSPALGQLVGLLFGGADLPAVYLPRARLLEQRVLLVTRTNHILVAVLRIAQVPTGTSHDPFQSLLLTAHRIHLPPHGGAYFGSCQLEGDPRVAVVTEEDGARTVIKVRKRQRLLGGRARRQRQHPVVARVGDVDVGRTLQRGLTVISEILA